MWIFSGGSAAICSKNKEDHSKKESHKALLEIAKNAMLIESERKKNLETRAGVLIGFNGLALVTLLNSSFKVYDKGIPAFKELTYDVCMFTPIVKLPLFSQYAPIVSMVLFSLCVLSLSYALFKYIQVIGRLYQYKGIEIERLIDLSIQESEYVFYMKSVAIYTHALNENRQLTERKFKDFRFASNILILAVFFLLVWFVFYNFGMVYNKSL